MKIVKYFFFLFSINAAAQSNDDQLLKNVLLKFDFIEEKIITQSDTITYYLKNYHKSKPSNLIVYIQGTDANPIFSYNLKDGKPIYYRWFGDDYKNIDSSSTFAIIPKPGMEGIYKDDDISIPKKYYQCNYKEYRVGQIDQSIDHIIHHHMDEVEKVIVYGHSEGAPIASALALENDRITHLGFWSGNVLNNFYEFSLFNRIESLKGQISDSLAHENIMGIIGWYKNVIENPNSTALDHFGFTNKRWATYEKAPIEELLSIEIPIYAMFASKDESTPIETAYLIPIQFMEKRKSNLTFEVCMDCDHSYNRLVDGTKVSKWNEVFMDFLNWTDRTTNQ